MESTSIKVGLKKVDGSLSDYDVGIGDLRGEDTIIVWWECTPLHEKAQKKTKNLPMKTTAFRNIPLSQRRLKNEN